MIDADSAFRASVACIRRALLGWLACAVLYPHAVAAAPGVDGQEIARQQARVLASIPGSVATGSSMLGEGALLVTTSFRREDWSGSVRAHRLDGAGRPGVLVWDAEARLAARSTASRRIYTQTTDGQTVELHHHHLDERQQAALELDPSSQAPTSVSGQDRVRWLRGDEVPGLRSRMSTTAPFALRRLADTVGSDLRFVAGSGGRQGQGSGFDSSSHTAFRAALATRRRPDVVYVGSNGGMLHAFHAGAASAGSGSAQAGMAAGEEMFAYVPGELLSPGESGRHAVISELMQPDYVHRLFVAGGVEVADVYSEGRWRTVLAGAMGAGGRTVFALDVTDPGSFQASDVMWEFRYSDEVCRADPAGVAGSTACRDIGYGIAQPKVVRLPTGRWAVVFGNGYHSTENRAKLFIVDLQSGRLLYLVDTGSGGQGAPNGMGSAAVTDWPASDLALNRVYAGDMLGNLWRVTVPRGGGAPQSERLMVASDARGVPQPIVAEPALAARPGVADQIVVAFGTGSLFDLGPDRAGPYQVQSFYGVFDRRDAAERLVRRDQLLEQQISAGVTPQVPDGAGSVRLVTRHGVDESHQGWLLDLPGEGERVIGKPSFPSGAWQDRIRFVTLVPRGAGEQGEGHQGFVMDIDLGSGGRSEKAVFAAPGGVYAIEDGAGTTPVSGVGGVFGRTLTSIRAVSAGVDHLYDGAGRKLVDSRNSAGPAGRQSWRQLR